MACVGRQKVCSVVPPNHFGPIPGIEVGTLWKFRVQVNRWLNILFPKIMWVVHWNYLREIVENKLKFNFSVYWQEINHFKVL
jgi:hypothetical protein